MRLRAYIPALIGALVTYYWYGDLAVAFLVALAATIVTMPFKKQSRRYMVRIVS
ncbi:MAG: hypothetical protein QXY49_00365 [Thermofilaceae archaeon]